MKRVEVSVDRRATDASGTVLMKAVHFPKAVDMVKAKAEYKNGLLTVTPPMATDAQARRLDIKAV